MKVTFWVELVRRSFDSLCSLRMTGRGCGGGTYLYRKSDFCPHSSSAPPGHLPPRGRVRRNCFLLLGCGGGTEVWADVVIGPYETVEERTYSLFTIHYYLLLLDWGAGKTKKDRRS